VAAEHRDDAWHRSADVAWVGNGERVVVLDLGDPTAARPQLMEGPAAAIWRAVDGVRDTDGVVSAVAAAAGLTTDEVAGDVAGFLEQLWAQGLLERGPATCP
jgi:hypothetical protein